MKVLYIFLGIIFIILTTIIVLKLIYWWRKFQFNKDPKNRFFLMTGGEYTETDVFISKSIIKMKFKTGNRVRLKDVLKTEMIVIGYLVESNKTETKMVSVSWNDFNGDPQEAEFEEDELVLVSDF